MHTFPLYFRLLHTVQAGSIRATVNAHGRCLLYQSQDAWWLNGVECGGITASGPHPVVAFQEFKATFRETMDRLAKRSSNNSEFSKQVNMFFGDVNQGAGSEWEACHAAIKADTTFNYTPLEKLPRQKSIVSPSVTVTSMDSPLVVEDEAIEVAA